MTEHLGFSWLGALFLLGLTVPNLAWTRHRPQGYDPSREDRRLALLEQTGQVSEAKISTRAKAREESQQTFFVDEGMEAAKRRLREIDVDTLTPLEALNLLYELKKLLK